MLGITDLKTGVKFIYNGEPHEVMSYQHSKTARAGAVMRTKLKNMITGSVIDKTFRGNEKFAEANVTREKGQFLYSDQGKYNFMNMSSYDQYEIDIQIIGDRAQFLQEGMDVDVVKYEGRAIGVDLPIKVSYEIIETQPGVKGDTAQGGSKPAKIATGASITVPLFINQGDKIIVDTRDGSYVERA